VLTSSVDFGHCSDGNAASPTPAGAPGKANDGFAVKGFKVRGLLRC
jgi:hypothetical protein